MSGVGSNPRVRTQLILSQPLDHSGIQTYGVSLFVFLFFYFFLFFVCVFFSPNLPFLHLPTFLRSPPCFCCTLVVLFLDARTFFWCAMNSSVSSSLRMRGPRRACLVLVLRRTFQNQGSRWTRRTSWSALILARKVSSTLPNADSSFTHRSERGDVERISGVPISALNHVNMVDTVLPDSLNTRATSSPLILKWTRGMYTEGISKPPFYVWTMDSRTLRALKLDAALVPRPMSLPSLPQNQLQFFFRVSHDLCFQNTQNPTHTTHKIYKYSNCEKMSGVGFEPTRQNQLILSQPP